MGLVVDPAALGGLAGLIALASWAVGRMQGGAPGMRDEPSSQETAEPGPAPARAAPAAAPSSQGGGTGAACQQRAFEERRALLAHPVALAELHAEASAIRRDERIFAVAAHSEALIAQVHAGHEGGCRFLGRSGQPTCPGPARNACDATGGCHALAARPAAAPSDWC